MSTPTNEDHMITAYTQSIASFKMMVDDFKTAVNKDLVIEMMVDYIVREIQIMNNHMCKVGELTPVSASYLEKFRDQVYKQLGHSSKAH